MRIFFYLLSININKKHKFVFLECAVVVTRSISCLVLRELASKKRRLKSAVLRGVGLVVDLGECGSLRA